MAGEEGSVALIYGAVLALLRVMRLPWGAMLLQQLAAASPCPDPEIVEPIVEAPDRGLT
jgi:hypothetical protein